MAGILIEARESEALLCSRRFHGLWITKIIFFCCRRYDEDDKAAWKCGSWCEYIFVVVVSAILLLAAIVLTVFWIVYYQGGYSLEDKSKLFNFHPTLMIAGYITLSGFCKPFKRITFTNNSPSFRFSSCAALPHLSLLFALGRQVVSRLFPRVLHPLHRHRRPGRLAVEERVQPRSLLLATFLARFHHFWTLRVPVCLRILQVRPCDVTDEALKAYRA